MLITPKFSNYESPTESLNRKMNIGRVIVHLSTISLITQYGGTICRCIMLVQVHNMYLVKLIFNIFNNTSKQINSHIWSLLYGTKKMQLRIARYSLRLRKLNSHYSLRTNSFQTSASHASRNCGKSIFTIRYN